MSLLKNVNVVKKFVLDANCLLEDDHVIKTLINGENDKCQNDIFIPYITLEELDGLKKNPNKRYRVNKIIREIHKFKEKIVILQCKTNERKPDNIIIETILQNQKSSIIKDPILITNDLLLQYKAFINNIKYEEYKSSKPPQSISQQFNGFSELENPINNTFLWKEGKPWFFNNNKEKCIDYEHEIWKIKPYDIYQNLAFELMVNRDDIPLVTVQSKAGSGKTLLSLASALNLVFQQKKYKKIYIVKSNQEVGKELGFRPGSVEEKIHPLYKPIEALLLKLHDWRPANKLFVDPEAPIPILNPRYIEFLPLNFIRGLNIDNAVVIVDELQNLSRDEARTLLSRMGQNVKCICTGDSNQVDTPHLNKDNNGFNWVVQKFIGDSRFAHIVINSKRSRGPICDLVNEKNL